MVRFYTIFFVFVSLHVFSQEKKFEKDYVNVKTNRKCFYFKESGKPFSGIFKENLENGDYQLIKIENACDFTLIETFDSHNFLKYRSEYEYTKANNNIVVYKNDSTNLGKSRIINNMISDSGSLIKKEVINFYHEEKNKYGILEKKAINGMVYFDLKEENPYAIFYKNGIPIYLTTFYFNKTGKISDLHKKEYFEVFANSNGAIYDSNFVNEKYGLIFKGQYLKWNLKGEIVENKIMN